MFEPFFLNHNTITITIKIVNSLMLINLMYCLHMNHEVIQLSLKNIIFIIVDHQLLKNMHLQ